MKFSPTTTQIEAAQQLFIAMSFLEMANQEFERMENELLQTGTYHYDTIFYSDNRKSTRLNFPTDRILRDRNDLFGLSGLSLNGQPEYEGTDSDKFFKELAKKAKQAGFIHAENAKALAEHDVNRLEVELIKATYNIHKTALDKLLMMEDRKKLLNLLLGIFAPLVKNESFEEKQKIFYNERMTEKVQLNTIYSFKKFQSLKTFIPADRFDAALTERIKEAQVFEGVEGILVYQHFAFLFQLNAGEENAQTGKVSYAFINVSNEIIQSTNLDIIERLLFKDFLKRNAI